MTATAEALSAGLDHHKAGRIKEAAEIYNRVLAAEPANAEALHLLGVLAFQEHRFIDAVGWFQRAVASAPATAKYLGNLASALIAAGRAADALAPLEQAIAIDATRADILNTHGTALRELGRGEAAIESYRRAIAANPSLALAHNNLVSLLVQLGRAEEAELAADRAIGAVPDDADLHNTRALVLAARGATAEARAALGSALALMPDHVDALRNLGMVLETQGDLAAAKAQFRRAIEAAPRQGASYASLAGVLLRQGHIDEAIALHRQAAELDADNPTHRSAIIAALGHDPHAAPSEITEECRRFDAEFSLAFKFASLTHRNDRTPDRRLRVGYLAPDLRRHGGPSGLLALLANHDRAAVEATLYTRRGTAGERAAATEEAGHRVRDLTGGSDDEVVRLIRSDAIDVLVDLAGHTPGNRLLVLVQRPAPVALSWPVEPVTSGLDGIGYVIADSVTVPEGETGLFTEAILRLPSSRLCFAAVPASAPSVAPAAPGETGATLWSTAPPAGINDRLAELWAAILRATPAACLVLAHPGFADAETAAELRARLVRFGAGPDRIALRPGARWDHAAAANAIVLDGAPRSDAVAAAAALSRGLPVVAFAGDRPLARQAAALLVQAGLDELIAATPADYVRIAGALAIDAERYAALARDARARFLASPACDAKRFARDFEALLRTAWHAWCARAT